ncbi:unnamed protein product [Tilletia caries]|nr:unnamed protein product [Tilletia caries]
MSEHSEPGSEGSDAESMDKSWQLERSDASQEDLDGSMSDTDPVSATQLDTLFGPQYILDANYATVTGANVPSPCAFQALDPRKRSHGKAWMKVASVPTRYLYQWFEYQRNDYTSHDQTIADCVRLFWVGHPGDSPRDVSARLFSVEFVPEASKKDQASLRREKGVVFRHHFECKGMCNVSKRSAEDACDDDDDSDSTKKPRSKRIRVPACTGDVRIMIEVYADDLSKCVIYQRGSHPPASDEHYLQYSRRIRLYLMERGSQSGAAFLSADITSASLQHLLEALEDEVLAEARAICDKDDQKGLRKQTEVKVLVMNARKIVEAGSWRPASVMIDKCRAEFNALQSTTVRANPSIHGIFGIVSPPMYMLAVASKRQALCSHACRSATRNHGQRASMPSNTHWATIIVKPSERSILLVDSSPSAARQASAERFFRTFLAQRAEMELGKGHDVPSEALQRDTWNFAYNTAEDSNFPQQDDGHSCGLITCKVIEAALKGKQPTWKACSGMRAQILEEQEALTFRSELFLFLKDCLDSS